MNNWAGRLLPLGIFSLLSISWTPRTEALWPFPSKRFTANAFVDAQTLGLDDAGRIVAFGDFDGDQFLDVVVLPAPTSSNSDQSLLHIYTWSHSDFQFFKNSTIQSPDSNPIINVVPADFTHDGKLDLLVMTSAESKLNMWLLVGDSIRGFEAAPVSVPPSTLSQPIPLDYDGNLRLDMIGNIPQSSVSPNPGETGTLKLWKNVWESSNGTILFDLISFNDSVELEAGQSSSIPECVLPNPHSSAIVDLDGDCSADLFLTCKVSGSDRLSYQIWLNDPSGGGFKLGQTGLLPKGAGMVSFADMDRDGTMDMVFPVCDSVDTDGVGHGCSVNIAYNKQIGICKTAIGGKKHEDCRRPENLCRADPNFKFDLSEGSSTMTSIPIMSLLRYSSLSPSARTTSLLMFDNTHTPPLPLPLKLGDANLDGFPDLLFIIVTPENERIPKLAWSVGCSSGEPGCPPIPEERKRGLFSRQQLEDDDDDDDSGRAGVGGRGYVVASSNGDAGVLATFKDAKSVSFLDLDEDGTLDILVQRTGKGTGGKGTGSGQKINFIQNNVFHDAFFMKAIVLNGACNGMCIPKDPNQAPYHPFGVSYSGGTYKYTVLDTSGKRSAAQISQLPQTSYHALQTPYSFFGLGRTNNYIENLFVGSTKKLRKQNHRRLQTRSDEPGGQAQPKEVQVVHARASSNASNATPAPAFGEGLYYINMEGVIPNSRVVIIPPDTLGVGEWKRELYLRPGEWIPWVTVTLVVATIILGIIVYAFHWNERREDELERRRALHIINFDAL
ncbi:hypothetical protein FRC20_011034 [Serendipita sp. 405]|nr:hypothetical protein FRC15_011083 [Serendipita sp. 397]KAG8801920.1 hypothetical protein FRC16_010811 [Serendipita sp. 398]KAG8836788.1 hypothetical protein FRC18_010743 [Serendipita sp. 400]KAG8870998.1 hypothetical protein FRC20_011034 [Serendipita sp. 405]